MATIQTRNRGNYTLGFYKNLNDGKIIGNTISNYFSTSNRKKEFQDMKFFKNYLSCQ